MENWEDLIKTLKISLKLNKFSLIISYFGCYNSDSEHFSTLSAWIFIDKRW